MSTWLMSYQHTWRWMIYDAGPESGRGDLEGTACHRRECAVGMRCYGSQGRGRSRYNDEKIVETLGPRICDAIEEEAKRWPADLIVIGTHGRRGFRRLLLGSVAEGVVELRPNPYCSYVERNVAILRHTMTVAYICPKIALGVGAAMVGSLLIPFHRSTRSCGTSRRLSPHEQAVFRPGRITGARALS